jgi:hypothetical protein
MSDARRLVDKLWSYCNVLRDDGVGVIEYTEQLTYLLFLKMAAPEVIAREIVEDLTAALAEFEAVAAALESRVD